MSKLRLTLLGACLCLAPCGAMAQGAAKLTDPQIAHIAYTAGQIDIQAAELALKQSKNKEVRAFADDKTVPRPQGGEREGPRTGEEAEREAEDNNASRSLMQQAGAKKKELTALKGAAFRPTPRTRSAYHPHRSMARSNALIPNASNGGAQGAALDRA